MSIPLFVGGTGRSGTTIAMEYLGANERVYASSPIELRIMTEPGGLLDLYDHEDIEGFTSIIRNRWLFGTQQTYGLYSSIDEHIMNKLTEDLVYSIKDNKKEAIAKFYMNLISNQKKFKKEATYIGDSTPSNIRFADRILNIMPDSKFIHMIRDGRDAAYSIFEMKDFFSIGGNKTEIDALDWWYQRTLQSFTALAEIPKDSYINVRLEDLIVNNINSEKSKIFSFLNIASDREDQDFFNKKMNVGQMSIGKWKKLENWKRFDLAYNDIIYRLQDSGIIIDRFY